MRTTGRGGSPYRDVRSDADVHQGRGQRFVVDIEEIGRLAGARTARRKRAQNADEKPRCGEPSDRAL